ncbi:MAG: phenylacetate--CoA ligase family protein [Candidatus Thorarchaeota archaeon]
MGLLEQFYQMITLSRNVTKPLDTIRNLQKKKLLRMIEYSYNTIPFYHRKFKKAGIHPSDINTESDMKKIPFTTKTELLSTPLSELTPRGIDLSRCHLSRTSGSTGTNMTIVYDAKAYAYERALTYRSNISAGQTITDVMLAISSPSAVSKTPIWFQKLGILPKYNVSVLTPVPDIIKTIDRIKPDILYGYASSLWTIATHLRDSKPLVKQPRIVMSTAELLDPKMRKDFENEFNALILDQFGCVEMGRTAWECPTHNGYHMNIDSVLFEFVRDNEEVAANEDGEIVYTNLYNFSMPLIRYAVGDIGSRVDEPCTCHRKLPLMKAINGRKDDFIIRKDGTRLSPILFALIMKYKEGVKRYRVIQKDYSHILIQVVPSDSYSEDVTNQIIEETSEIIGDQFSIVVDLVDSIEEKGTGKIRSVISDVPFSW